MPLVQKELFTHPWHLSSPPLFLWGSCYSIFSFMCMFCSSLFVFFPLVIVLSVFLWFTGSDYPFGIFKLFLETGRKGSLANFSSLFRNECKWIINFTTMYVYCVYPAMSKSSKTTTRLSKKSRNMCRCNRF